MAALEARLQAGRKSEARLAVGHEWAQPLVERWQLAHECSLSQVLVRPYAARLPAGCSAALLVRFMNRRMRNRKSGGVGGIVVVEILRFGARAEGSG